MSGSIKDQVAIVGVGCTKFGDNFDHSFEDLLVDAGFAACKSRDSWGGMFTSAMPWMSNTGVLLRRSAPTGDACITSTP